MLPSSLTRGSRRTKHMTTTSSPHNVLAIHRAGRLARLVQRRLDPGRDRQVLAVPVRPLNRRDPPVDRLARLVQRHLDQGRKLLGLLVRRMVRQADRLKVLDLLDLGVILPRRRRRLRQHRCPLRPRP